MMGIPVEMEKQKNKQLELRIVEASANKQQRRM